MFKLTKTLESLGYIVDIYNNTDQVKEALLKKISKDDTVGFGGSVTVDQVGIYEALEARGNEVYWHWKAEDKPQALRKATNSDVYISSSNALTEDGKLVNKDGVGNRVASMIYGHRDVYIVVGNNKICRDYEAANERIQSVAGPKNAMRLGLNTPCVQAGRCNNCNSPERICNVESIIDKNPNGTQINILLVNEVLGY